VKARIRFAYFSCCILWGSTWMAIKIGLRDLPPLFFAGARMLLAAAILLPFAWRAGLRLQSRERLEKTAWIGLLQIGIPYALMFAAQQWLPSALTAVLFATFPVWLVLAARLLLHDQPLTPRKLTACALGVAGVLVLQLPALRAQDLSPLAPVGGALVIAAAIVAAFANVYVRKELQAQAPMVITFVQVFTGALFLVILSLLLERGRPAAFTLPATAVLVYLAVFGTAVTYLCLFWLIPRVPMAAIGAIPLLDTTVAVTLGALVLRERIGWPLLAGGALVLTAVALANQAPAEPALESP
jgi:drug/metabolite transporter (DMT)-like permease